MPSTTIPWPSDPEGGVPLNGSGGAHVHRATGEDDPQEGELPGHNRHGIRVWVTQGRDATACKSFEQFQFSRTSVFIVNADGTDTNIDADAGRFRNRNKYGGGTPSRERFGHWEADDYSGTHSAEKVTMPGETDLNGRPLKAGPYYGPPPATSAGSPIPGVSGAIGVVDAPQLAWPPFAFDALREHEKNKHLTPGEHRKNWPGQIGGAQPANEGPYTMKFKIDFRDYIYCLNPKKCLAYYEWHLSETVIFEVVYVDSRSQVDKDANDPPRWRPTQKTTDYTYEGPIFDPFVQPCPQ